MLVIQEVSFRISCKGRYIVLIIMSIAEIRLCHLPITLEEVEGESAASIVQPKGNKEEGSACDA